MPHPSKNLTNGYYLLIVKGNANILIQNKITEIPTEHELAHCAR